MSNKPILNVSVDSNSLLVRLENVTGKYVGMDAKVTFGFWVQVDDMSPINASSTLEKREIVLGEYKNEVIVDISDLEGYSYSGEKIKISGRVVCEINDGYVFDTTLKEFFDFENTIVNSNKTKSIQATNRFNLDISSGLVGKLVSTLKTQDKVDYIKNFKAISLIDKLLLILLILFFIYLLFGQAVSYFYGLYIEPSSFTLSALIAFLFTWIISFLIYFVIFGSLIFIFATWRMKKYTTFTLQKVDFAEEVNKEYSINELITGKSRVDLRDSTIRVVAYNEEKGQYKRGSGTNTRTVSFSHPIQEVILFEKKVDFIPKNAPIENYILGKFSFEEIYQKFYPPFLIGKSHGIGIKWKIILINDDYIDREIVGPIDFIEYKNFKQTNAK